MNGWLSILEYRDFWDFPRVFIVDCLDETYLFDCEFDEQAEDYTQEFSVYLMPPNTKENLAKSWENLARNSIRSIFKISINDVQFDKTKRRYINEKALTKLLTEQ